MHKIDFDRVFKVYEACYNHILGTSLFYPALNGTGFQERNLSVNFAKAYQSICSSAICWFEFQFGDKNNQHYDALIIDPENKVILLVESKRFSTISGKVKEVKEDVERILAFEKDSNNQFSCRISDLHLYTIYGVILADVWTISDNRKYPGKVKLKESFDNQAFADVYLQKEYTEQLDIPLILKEGNVTYYTQHIPVRDAAGYFLTSFVWQVSV